VNCCDRRTNLHISAMYSLLAIVLQSNGNVKATAYCSFLCRCEAPYSNRSDIFYSQGSSVTLVTFTDWTVEVRLLKQAKNWSLVHSFQMLTSIPSYFCMAWCLIGNIHSSRNWVLLLRVKHPDDRGGGGRGVTMALHSPYHCFPHCTMCRTHCASLPGNLKWRQHYITSYTSSPSWPTIELV
jgi:hypothetical protein